MQEIKPNLIFKEPNRFNWIASISLLSITLLSILGFYVYSYFQANTIASLESEILQLETDLKLASEDKDIILANILNSTTIRPSIDLKAVVDSFQKTANWAGVRLQGFAVRDDILATTLIASQDGNDRDPIEIIIALMRSNNQSSGLKLNPINALQGSNNERTTGVTFQILPSKSTSNASK